MAVMYIIEDATVGDIPRIKDLLTFAWRDAYSDVLSPETIDKITNVWHNQELFKNQIEDPSSFFVVARDGSGDIVGLATAVEVDENTCMLARHYVRPDYQRRGIGEGLVKAALKHFPNAEKLQVEVLEKNIKGYAFSIKAGFKEIRRFSESIGNDIVETIIMEKDING